MKKNKSSKIKEFIYMYFKSNDLQSIVKVLKVVWELNTYIHT